MHMHLYFNAKLTLYKKVLLRIYLLFKIFKQYMKEAS